MERLSFKAKRLFGFLFLSFSLLLLGKVEGKWFSPEGIASPEKPSVSLLRSDPTTVSFEITVKGVNYEVVTTEGGMFSQISLPGIGFNKVIGRPKLPVIRELVEIPYGATPSLQIVSFTSEEYGLKDLGLEYPILPSQPSRPKEGKSIQKFFIDRACYSQDTFFPQKPFTIGPEGTIRGHRFIPLEVYPLIYNPGKARVKLIIQLELQINLSGSDVSSTEVNLKRLYSSSWENLAQNTFLNYGTYERSPWKASPEGYLIITADDLGERLQPLKEWIGKKGFLTVMVKTSEVGSDTASLRAFIKYAYENWPNPPAYVLLVGEGDKTGGDSSYIQPYPGRYPSEWGNKANATDLHYSTVDGSDFFPDIGIGRLSVKNPEEAEAVVDKILDFEKLENPCTDWLSQGTFIASRDNHELTEGTHNEMALNYFGPRGVLSTMVYSYFGGMTSDINSALNRGQVWVNYSGHGSQANWQDPGYSGANIEGLTNQGMYPFVISNACLTGTFNSPVCLGEQWLRAEYKGGVGFWGASNETYWDDDDVLERGLYASGFGEGLHTLSGMTNGAKLKLFQYYGLMANVKYYFEVYNLLGEPSLDLFIGAPDTFVVSHKDTLPLLAQTMEVCVDQDSTLVSLYKDEILYGVAYSQGGGADVRIYPQISSPGTLYVTVTKHNFTPYLRIVEVISPAISTVSPDSIPISTSTKVKVTVLDEGTAQPIPDVEVAIRGWGLSLVDTSNSSGEAYLTVYPPYGEVLSVKGKRIGDDYDLFADSIWVIGGSDLSSPSLNVSSALIGLTDTLTPGFPGEIQAQVDPPEFSLFAKGCNVDTSVYTSDSTTEVEVIPDTLGNLHCVIAKTSFNIYQRDIPVIKTYGWLSGVVYDSFTLDSLSGVQILGFPQGADTFTVPPLFQPQTVEKGRFEVGERLPVGRYDLYLERFGYTPKKIMILLRHNTNEIALSLSPVLQGRVEGTVYDLTLGEPLSATINILTKEKDLWLYTSIQTDSLQGGRFSVDLPYFDYIFKVNSWLHLPQTSTISVAADSLIVDFGMHPFTDSILVIDDEGGKGIVMGINHERKGQGFGEKKAKGSADVFVRYLRGFEFDTKLETPYSSDPTTWDDYPFIIWSDGGNQSPVDSIIYRNALENYVEHGGKLLIEGGELGYDSWAVPGYPSFAQNVLHIAGWEGDEAGDLSLVSSFSDHPIASSPNRLPQILGIMFDPDDWGDQDASIPAEDALVIYKCKERDAGVLVYDPTPDPQGGQIVFYSFNLLALTDSLQRKNLLENTLFYLLADEEEPEGAISGTIDLKGSEDNGGAVVTLSCRGFSVPDTTSFDGSWSLGGLYKGNYTLQASRDGYEDTLLSEVVISYAETTLVNLDLYPRIDLYFSDFDSDSGALSSSGDWQWGIPQSGPGEAHSDSNLWATSLDSSYADRSNSILNSPKLYFPNSSRATLQFWHWHKCQDRDGGNLKISVNGNNWQIIDPEDGYPQGWVPLDNFGIPGERCYTGNHSLWEKATFNLSPYVGKGDTAIIRWQFGSDGSDTESGWYIDDVRVYYVDYTAGIQDKSSQAVCLPTSYTLFQNSPNPFNSKTLIRYALPRGEFVEIKIFNILGEEVKTLLAGYQGAGYRSILWDAGGLSSGIYFCQFKSGHFRGVRKLLLLK
jgi:hypothetical protein